MIDSISVATFEDVKRLNKEMRQVVEKYHFLDVRNLYFFPLFHVFLSLDLIFVGHKGTAGTRKIQR